MYICVCNAVTDRDIEKAVENGVTNFGQLTMATGCSTQCGTCTRRAQAIMNRALKKQGTPRTGFNLRVVQAS